MHARVGVAGKVSGSWTCPPPLLGGIVYICTGCRVALPRLAHCPGYLDFQILPHNLAYGISGILSRCVYSPVLRRTKLSFVFVYWVPIAVPIYYPAVLKVRSLKRIDRAVLSSCSSF